MPSIEWVIFGSELMDHPQRPNESLICNPSPYLRPQFIPSLFTFAMSILISEIDTTAAHKMTLEIKDPQDNDVFQLQDGNFDGSTISESPLKLEHQSIVVFLQVINAPLRFHGEYKLILTIDGQNKLEKVFLVLPLENPYGNKG